MPAPQHPPFKVRWHQSIRIHTMLLRWLWVPLLVLSRRGASGQGSAASPPLRTPSPARAAARCRQPGGLSSAPRATATRGRAGGGRRLCRFLPTPAGHPCAPPPPSFPAGGRPCGYLLGPLGQRRPEERASARAGGRLQVRSRAAAAGTWRRGGVHHVGVGGGASGIEPCTGIGPCLSSAALPPPPAPCRSYGGRRAFYGQVHTLVLPDSSNSVCSWPLTSPATAASWSSTMAGPAAPPAWETS